MADATCTGFVADMIDPDDVSRDRLLLALQLGQPQALDWCELRCSKVSRSTLVATLRAALPRLLLLRWDEVRRRALRSPLQTALFRPQLDVFDGSRAELSVDFYIEIALPLACLAEKAQQTAPVDLRLALGLTGQAQRFHEMRREMRLPRAVARKLPATMN
jgi:hypothetical protein